MMRELAVLATAFALDQRYEQFHHLPAARKVGVREEQIAAFPHWASADVWDATERAVLAYAEQVARIRDVDDETFAELRRRLSAEQLVDLVVTVAWYHLCAAILGPLRIEPEDVSGR